MKRFIVMLALLMLQYAYGQPIEYSMPESIVYNHKSQAYYISNFGNGNIVKLSKAGEASIFKSGLVKPLGMLINENTLYVVNGLKSVSGFSLENGKMTFDAQIDSAVFLNDLTFGKAGKLYVTDSNKGAVFEIDTISGSARLLLKTALDNPNGIFFDAKGNRLIVCYFRKQAVINEISLDTLAVKPLVNANYTNLDGIARDAQGNYYVSSWGEGSFKDGFKEAGVVYQFNSAFEKLRAIPLEGHHGPADIYFNPHTSTLAIPMFITNRLLFLSKDALAR